MKTSRIVWTLSALAMLVWGGCAPRQAANPGEAEAAAARDAWVPQDEAGGWYAADCQVCHGERLAGGSLGPSLLLDEFEHGDSVDAIVASIAEGFPDAGMPPWEGRLPPEKIRGLAIYILEQRVNAKRDLPQGAIPPLVVPEGTLRTEHHAFRVHDLRGGIEHPYSIAPLPDGRVVLSEKALGLSVVSADGATATRVSGTPRFYTDAELRGNQYTGNGWAHDVALHPDYADNGWIYLSYGDRCEGCNTESRESGKPVSMIALVRGRIVDGVWRDQETIWQADKESYQHSHELGTGARIAFDDAGHVFLSLGVMTDYRGVQSLGKPYGKVLRLHDDGRVPKDNPFAETPGALPEVWTLGHRNPQGMDFDRSTGRLWVAEHGPRGGDEGNLILPGRNYGWPLVSLGVDYDGLPIRYAEKYGLEFDSADLTGPVIDWTPSIGVSSIVFYRGAAFPAWRDHMLVAELNGNDLLRVETSESGAVHSETLIRGLGRIRDVEVGPEGRVFLLVEHPEGSRILRLDPVVG